MRVVERCETAPGGPASTRSQSLQPESDEGLWIRGPATEVLARRSGVASLTIGGMPPKGVSRKHSGTAVARQDDNENDEGGIRSCAGSLQPAATMALALFSIFRHR